MADETARPVGRPSAGRRVVLLAGGLLIYGAHLPLVYAILLGKNPRRAVPLILVLLLGIPLATRYLAERGRVQCARALAAVYYAIVAAYFAGLLYVIHPMGAGRLVLMALLACAFGRLLRNDWRAPAWILAALPVAHAAFLHPAISLAAAAVLAAGLLLGDRNDRPGFAPAALAVAFFSLAVHAEGFTFYRGVSVFDRFRDLGESVERLSPDNAQNAPANDPGLRFAVPACEAGAYLVGRRGGEYGVERIEGGKPGAVARGLAGLSAADNAVVDCERGVAWVGIYGREGVAKVDARTLDTIAVYSLPTVPATFVELDETTYRLYAATDFGGLLHVLDASNGALVRSLQVPGGVAHFLVDRGGDRVVAVSGGANLYTFEAPNWEPVLRRKFNGALILQLAEIGDRIYLTNFLLGTLDELDARSLATYRRWWLGPSVRFLRPVEDDDALAIASYFGGTITEMDLTTGERTSTYVGKRPRWIEPDRSDPDRVVTTTVYGPVAVRLRGTADGD